MNKSVYNLLVDYADFWARMSQAYKRGFTENEIVSFRTELAILDARKGAITTELENYSGTAV